MSRGVIQLASKGTFDKFGNYTEGDVLAGIVEPLPESVPGEPSKAEKIETLEHAEGYADRLKVENDSDKDAEGDKIVLKKFDGKL